MEGGSEWRFYSRVTRAGRKQMALAQGGGRKLYGIERVGGTVGCMYANEAVPKAKPCTPKSNVR